MPLRYKIIENKKLAYVVGTGAVTFSELMNHVDELSKDPKYKAPMKKLVDYREINKLDLSMKEQESFAQKKASAKESFAGEKCAIVVTTDYGFALARVHVSLSEGADRDTAVYRDFKKALAWLNVEIDDELIRS